MKFNYVFLSQDDQAKQTIILDWIKIILPLYEKTIETRRELLKLLTFGKILQVDTNKGFFTHPTDFHLNKTQLEQVDLLKDYKDKLLPNYQEIIKKMMQDNNRIGTDVQQNYENHFFRNLEKLVKCIPKKEQITADTFASIINKTESFNQIHIRNIQAMSHLQFVEKPKVDDYINNLNSQLVNMERPVKNIRFPRENIFDRINRLLQTAGEFQLIWTKFGQLVENFAKNFGTEIEMKKEIANEIDSCIPVNGGMFSFIRSSLSLTKKMKKV